MYWYVRICLLGFQQIAITLSNQAFDLLNDFSDDVNGTEINKTRLWLLLFFTFSFSPTPGCNISIISDSTVWINLFVPLSEGSKSMPSICESWGYLFTVMCFSSEIVVDGLVDGAIDKTLDVAECISKCKIPNVGIWYTLWGIPDLASRTIFYPMKECCIPNSFLLWSMRPN